MLFICNRMYSVVEMYFLLALRGLISNESLLVFFFNLHYSVFYEHEI